MLVFIGEMKECKNCANNFNDYPKYITRCFICGKDVNKLYFKEKEDVKMSKVTIEYEEVKKPIKGIAAKTVANNEVIFCIKNSHLVIECDFFRSFEKETAIELVAALNELVKQL